MVVNSNCYPRSLDQAKERGNIVVCSTNEPYIPQGMREATVQGVEDRGMVIVEDLRKNVDSN